MTEYVLRGDYNQSSSTRMSTTLLSSMASFLLHIAQINLILFPHSSINAGVQAHSLCPWYPDSGHYKDSPFLFLNFPSVLEKWH